MALFSYLQWGEKRAGLLKITDHPKLAEFISKFEKCPGVKETAFT
jgi:hypothetical protein